MRLIPRLFRLDQYELLRDLKCRMYFALDIWEKADTTVRDVIQNHVKEGFRCVDVGANRGRMIGLMLNAGAKTVYAFEPLPDLSQKLRQRYRRNQNVFISTCALSDYTGISSFYRTEGDLTSSLAPNGKYKIVDCFPIAVDRLDSFNLGRIDFIKIDVEGFEPAVLRGAAATIDKYHPVIIVECFPDYNTEIQILRFFDMHGYDTIRFDSEILGTYKEVQ